MNNPLVQPDPGLFIWTILTFLILLGLLAKFAWRPLLQALDARQAAIRKSLDEAEKARKELEEFQHQSARLLRDARAEAESIVARSRADAEKVREDIKGQAKAEAENILRQAQRQIELETRQAIQQIHREVVDLSVMIASKLLQRNVSKEDNARLIEDSLHQIEARLQ
jgi:F-type H+-transporting ATPase subunit b